MINRIESDEKFNESRNQHATSDMVRTNELPPAKTAAGSVAGYRFLAVLFAVLAVGGLFLGLLGRAWSAVFPSAAFTAYGSTLSGSLIGYAVDYFKYLGDGGFTIAKTAGATGILSTLVDLLLILALFAAVVFAIAALFVTIFSKKRARRFALVSGVLLFLTYLGLFLWSYFSMSQTAVVAGVDKLSREICDVPTAILATILLFVLSITAIVQNRSCVVNAFLLVASTLVAFLTCYPATLTITISLDLLSFKSFAFAKFATLFFFVVIAFNIAASAIRLFSKRAYGFDCLRFALLLFAAIFAVIGFISTPLLGGRWAIFKGVQLYCTIGFLALSVAAFVAAVLVTVLLKRKQKLAAYAETFPGMASDEAEPSPLFASAPTARENAALSAEQSADLFMPVTVEAGAEIAQSKEAPMSEFERRMEALARGEQPDYAPKATAQPAFPARANANNQPRNAGYADQYTYDPFINSLSPQEKNEFGDLFIACKAGKVEGLPLYSIGGNNEEFFHKVFIYLGKFRKDISSDLLDKLYLYVSRNS